MDGRQRAASAVAARRGELDMTQGGLADAAGVDIKTVGNLESRGRWPIARTRARIERALGWPSGELDRIAREPEPEIDPDVMDWVQRTFSPRQRDALIEAMRAALRGGPPAAAPDHQPGTGQSAGGRRAG